MISLWTVDLSGSGGIVLCKSESQFVHVPDPSTMDVLPSENSQDHVVAISGIGIQTFDVHGQ
jgi:uroporphyrinogen-III synthase